MSAEKDDGPAEARDTPAIAYKRELEALREQRRKPTATLDCTIGGGSEQSLHRELDRLREQRIAVLDNRLRGVKGHIENEFAVSKEREHAKRDFGRSR